MKLCLLSSLAILSATLLSSHNTCLARSKLRGSVKMDGSSTVFPLAEAVAEEFQKSHPRVRVTVGLSGTGGGFKKFSAQEIDIASASRPIKRSEEMKLKRSKVDYLEIPVAYDGISVVIHPENKFATKLTMKELKDIWKPHTEIKTWNQVRASFPNKKIKLYGPGADSGTFDFFTKKVMGKSRQSRSDYVSSEDDNVLVRGIGADKFAMGYFGYAYYLANQDKLNVVSIKKKDKFVTPSPESIEAGNYPLSRPLLIYVDKSKLQKPELAKFLEFFISNAANLSKEVGYIPLPKAHYEKSLSMLRSLTPSL